MCRNTIKETLIFHQDLYTFKLPESLSFPETFELSNLLTFFLRSRSSQSSFPTQFRTTTLVRDFFLLRTSSPSSMHFIFHSLHFTSLFSYNKKFSEISFMKCNLCMSDSGDFLSFLTFQNCFERVF